MNFIALPAIRRLGLALLALAAVGIHATPSTTYTWTGQTTDNQDPNSLYNSGNWLDGVAPPSTSWDNTEDIFGIHLLFGDSRRTYVQYYALYANQIEFRDISQPYYLQGIYATTHLGSGGIIYAPTQNLWSTIADSVQLHASQTWAINAGTLSIYGNISDQLEPQSNTYGGYGVEKTGAGTLQLSGSYTGTWSGGLTLTEGLVTAGGDLNGTLEGALGFGTLTFNGGALTVWPSYYTNGYEDGGVALTNNIVSKGLIDLRTDTEVAIVNADQAENFIRLDADTTLKVTGENLVIEKDIIENEGTGPHALTVDSYAAIIHYGASLWNGGTQVDKGIFIFGGEDNLPVTGSITVGDKGYVGIGADNDMTDFLAKINKPDSTGTLGFDSDPDEQSIPDSFTAPIDLTGANPALRIGSASEAILGDLAAISSSSEQITPAGDNYRFGGGGGNLYVASLLTNAQTSRGIEVDSPAELPLTVWLINPYNDFTGDVSVNNSALIYGPGVTPDAEAAINLNATGYAGTAEKTLGTNWLDYFSPDTPGIIGFDIFPGDEAPEPWVIDNLDTSRFSTAAIGSASYVRDENGDIDAPGLILTGSITPNSDGTHRFAAYKGGAVAVNGTLTGDSLIVGRPDSIATFGDRLREEYSTVLIGGDNSGHLAGGTTFYSGRLLLNHNQALGDGTLTIAPVAFTEPDDGETPSPQLGAFSGGLVFANDLIINAEELGVGGEYDFELAGDISGTGELYVGEDTNGGFSLTLSGNNANFSGGIYLSNYSNLTIASDNGAGTGPLGFGYSGGTVYFETSTPVIGGFSQEGDGSYANLTLASEAPSTLTINQQAYGQFYGYIGGNQTATIVKTGAGTLRFDSSSIAVDGIDDGAGNNIGLEVQQGTVIFSNYTSLGDDHTAAVKISGGTFAADGSYNQNGENSPFYNPVIVGSGGRLAGFGTYAHDISIGNGAILSPGLADNGMTGSIQFHHLELDAGGIYEFDVQSPDFGDYVGRDIINVFNPTSQNQTLVINADSAHPFIIRVYSVNEAGERGFLDDIDSDHGMYSWTLIAFDELVIPSTSNLFDPALFSLELDGFNANLTGDFNLALDGNNIVLQFTPVPEPSTYAMLALGLGIVAWSIHRRRRAKT